EPAEIEVPLVVDDEHVARLQLEERRRGPDRAAGIVHVRLWLQQREPLVAYPHLGHLAREFAAPRAAVPARELVHDHPAGVVAVPGVLPARVPQTGHQQQELALGRALVAGGVRLRLRRLAGCTFGSLALGALFALFAFLE